MLMLGINRQPLLTVQAQCLCNELNNKYKELFIMELITQALKAIKLAFPKVIILNNEDKNGNDCIVLLGIENAFSEMQLKSHSQFSDLFTAVESLPEERGVSISYTSPTDSNKQDGKALIFIGKSGGEADLDNLSL